MPWSGRKSYRFGGYAMLIDPGGASVYRDYIDGEHPGTLELATSNIIVAATHYTDLLAHKIMEECRDIAAAQNHDRYTGAPL